MKGNWSQPRRPLVIPNEFAALASEQTNCFAFARVEDDHDAGRLRSAYRTQKPGVVVSRFARRMLVWIAMIHRAPQLRRTRPKHFTLIMRFGAQVNSPGLKRTSFLSFPQGNLEFQCWPFALDQKSQSELCSG